MKTRGRTRFSSGQGSGSSNPGGLEAVSCENPPKQPVWVGTGGLHGAFRVKHRRYRGNPRGGGTPKSTGPNTAAEAGGSFFSLAHLDGHVEAGDGALAGLGSPGHPLGGEHGLNYKVYTRK